MERMYVVWFWLQRVSGICVLVCLSLYLVRCLLAGDVVGLDEFDWFLRGLLRYVFQ